MQLTRKRLMEVAGLRNLLNESAKAAIKKNKAALSAAIEKRLADPEDMDAHDAVEKLIIKTALNAGLPKDWVKDQPWMEQYAVPDESTADGDIENLEAELNDSLNDPDIMSSGSSKEKDVSANSNGEEIIKVLEELGTFDNLAKTLDQIGSVYTKGASQGVYLIGGGGTDPIEANIVNPTEGLSSIYTYTYNCYAVRDEDKMFAIFTESATEPGYGVEIKNNKPAGKALFGYRTSTGAELKQMQTKFGQKLKTITDLGNPNYLSGAYTYGTPGFKPGEGLRIPYKNFQESNLKISEEVDTFLKTVLLFLLPLKNPVMTGKVKVPEFSKIVSEMISLVRAGESVVAPKYNSGAGKMFKSYPLPSSDDTKSLVDWFRNTLKAVADKSVDDKSVNESIFEQITKVKKQLWK